MKTGILVLGSEGMLGHMVLDVLSEEKTFEVHGTHIKNKEDLFYFDAAAALEKLELIVVKSGDYGYFINCIGITKDKIDEENRESIRQAERINAVFPRQLAEFANKKNLRVIQISTDGVFSGAAEQYNEDAPHDCTGIYGKTKSVGEITADNFLNIRCSIIGPSPFEKRGLLEWFLSQPEGARIKGYTNHFWNGVSTLQFAELCRKIIKEDCFEALRKESPVFHFAPNCQVSKYELLTLFKSAFGKNITIDRAEKKGEEIKRILVSKYNGLKKMYGHDLPMIDAVTQLKERAICQKRS